ncbi:pentapeptide repeat-containing protein [Aureimonas glaciei]|uniref:pentapeptide repeat-containing protein n=1 Tax=Aureimonas glaciei TaxID=1776957 RepID=UPI00237BB407|nr:pentapeptide repeat-containing protein [Aureimonas glaciei]
MFDRDPFRIRLRDVFMRRTDWSGADLIEADLSGSDLSHASLAGANLESAKLDGTILRGADLTDAQNLTVEQLRGAILDAETKLPAYIDGSLLSLAAAE